MTEPLMTQTEARTEAKRLNASGEIPDQLVAIAVAVPRNSWGGHEKGWTVILVVPDR